MSDVEATKRPHNLGHFACRTQVNGKLVMGTQQQWYARQVSLPPEGQRNVPQVYQLQAVEAKLKRFAVQRTLLHRRLELHFPGCILAFQSHSNHSFA